MSQDFAIEIADILSAIVAGSDEACRLQSIREV
jgi:hypothetical protein